MSDLGSTSTSTLTRAHDAHARGTACYRSGDLAGAVAAWWETLALYPGYPGALRNLAVVLKRTGDWDALAPVLRRMIIEAPGDGWAWFNHGVTQTRFGRSGDGIAAYRRVLHINPADGDALWNLAVMVEAAERWVDAAALWRRMAALQPTRPKVWWHVAWTQWRAQEKNTGVAAAAALLETPRDPRLLNIRALAEYARGHLESAATLWCEAWRGAPDSMVIVSNLSVCLKKIGQPERADAVFRRALALFPDNGEVRYNYAMHAFLMGRMAEGGRHWEARYDKGTPVDSYMAGRLPVLRRLYHSWDGRDGRDIHLFLHAEQGLGDTIQYIRFVAAARERVGRVTVACQRPLAKLLHGTPGIDRLILRDDPIPDDITHFAPLMSLPWLLGIGLGRVNPRMPYLQAEPAGAVPLSGPGPLRVGLVWSGNPTYADNVARSFTPDLLRPILDVPGVAAVSLQKGGADAIMAAGLGGRLPSPVVEATDLTETASMIAALDLVITVDTSVAHLAGAMGRPVWVLLSLGADWRWLLNRGDSPWYPSARLFRQRQRGDWPEVVARVTAELAGIAARKLGKWSEPDSPSVTDALG